MQEIDIVQQRIKKLAEEYANKYYNKNSLEYIRKYPNREYELWDACVVNFIAGWKACIDQEEWKNLYTEGIEMGRKLERGIIENKPIE